MKAQQTEEFWRDLYYIRVRVGGKMPATAWGGYNQDFDEVDEVYSWDELKSNVEYAYIGHKEYQLGVIDVDIYKDYAPDVSEVTHWDSNLIVRTPSGGFHFPFLVPEDVALRVRPKWNDWIDLKGEINKGHVLLPYNNDYDVVQEGKVPVVDVESGEHTSIVQRNGEGVIETFESLGTYDGDNPYNGIHTLLSEDEYPIGERTKHPIHGSSTGNNFMVDENEETWRCWRHETTGNLVHLLGMKFGILECGEWDIADPGELEQKREAIFKKAKEEGIRLHEPREYGIVPGFPA